MRSSQRFPALRGRERELDAFSAVWNGAAEGRLRILLVSGEAGIGKTRLVEEALRRATALGFAVYHASCVEHEHNRAFAALTSAFGRRFDDVIDVAPGELAPSHFRLIEELLGQLEETALERPVALVLDDLHWADPATLAALRTFAGRIPYVPLALVGIYRPLPHSQTLVRTVTELLDGDAREIVLGPLDDETTARLVEDAVNATPDDRLLAFVRRAHGNPLYLHELVHALQVENAIETAGTTATLSQTSLPADLPRTILRRLSFLSDEAVEVLRFAAILGSSFSPAHVAVAVGRPVASLLTALSECVTAGVVIEDGPDTCRFRHDLIREALYLDIPAALRSALHVEAARALSTAGASLAIVAAQYAAGAQPGDRDAIGSLRRAALTQERSPTTRVDLLRRACNLAAPLDDVRPDVLTDLADALLDAGRADEAERVAGEALQHELAPGPASRMRSAVLRAQHMAARFGDVVEQACRWLADPGIAEAERGRLLAASALARSVTRAGPSADALREAEEALRIGEHLDEDGVRFAALRALSHARGSVGDGPGQLDAAARALALAERDPTAALDREHPQLTMAQAWADVAFRDSYALGRERADAIASCERVLNEALRTREDRGTLWDLPEYLTLLARVRFNQGRHDDSLAEAEAAVAAGAETGSRAGLVNAHLVAAAVVLNRGELGEMERHIVAAEELVETYGNQWNDPRRARAVLHLFRREWDELGGVLWRIFEDLSIGDAPWSPYLMAFVYAANGRRDRAQLVCEHARAWAERTRTRDAEFQAALSKALVEPDVEWLVQLIDVSEDEAPAPDSGIWLWTSCTLAQKGRAPEATQAFKLSIGSYEHDSPFIVESYAAIARTFGVRFRLRRRPRPATTGWTALTDSERCVVELAAEGLTNPQIGDRLSISRRTVQTHLRHVFQKLAISSRVELAAAVARRRADDQSAL